MGLFPLCQSLYMGAYVADKRGYPGDRGEQQMLGAATLLVEGETALGDRAHFFLHGHSLKRAQERKKYRHFYIGRSQQVGLYTESCSFKAEEAFL
jgi:hypothetical protein